MSDIQYDSDRQVATLQAVHGQINLAIHSYSWEKTFTNCLSLNVLELIVAYSNYTHTHTLTLLHLQLESFLSPTEKLQLH